MTIINHLNILNSDIICGRGKGFDRYVGNQIFRDVIKGYSATYIGYGANRTAKSNTIRKIFEDIVVYKNMRFVTHTNQRGWVLMEEREIKLKIGHALRDVDTVRQKQARKRTEGKRTNKKKPSTASTKSPVEDAQLKVILHSNDAENLEPLKSALATMRSKPEPSLLQEKEHTDSAHIAGVGSCAESRTPSCCCSCQGKPICEQLHVKQDKTAGMSFDGVSLENMLMKNFIPLDYKRGGNTSFVLPDVDDIITPECPLTPFYPLHVEPLPLSDNFLMDRDDLQALSSLCGSLRAEDRDASSTSFDAAFSAVFPECTEDTDDNVDIASMDWLF